MLSIYFVYDSVNWFYYAPVAPVSNATQGHFFLLRSVVHDVIFFKLFREIVNFLAGKKGKESVQKDYWWLYGWIIHVPTQQIDDKIVSSWRLNHLIGYLVDLFGMNLSE